MTKKNLLNEQGITLIELLATIVISSLIIGLVTNVFISASKQNELVTNHNSLRQEANLIISKLRQIHQAESYTLCYESNNQFYFDKQFTNKITSDQFYFSDVLIDNSSTSITSNGQCIENVDVLSPLLVKFTLQNLDGQTYDMNTVINRLNPITAVETPPLEEEEEVIIDEDSGNYTDSPSRCTYEGNTRTNDSTFAPTWGTKCQITKVKNGSFMLNNNVTVFESTEINVDHNLIAKLPYTMQHQSNLNVGKSAKFYDAIKLLSDSVMYISQNLEALKDIRLDNNSNIIVERDAKIEGLETYTNTNFDIGGDFLADKQVKLENQSTISIGGNAQIEGDLEIKGKGNVSVLGNYHSRGMTKLQDTALLQIYGDATFESPISLIGGNSGKVCVKGEAIFSSSQDRSKVSYASSCEGQPNGTIFVLNNQ
ncbi:hypothetical protein B4U37_15980 [Sutcliffiella horikoshii]|uniref:Prepilin-type N-terminal cleavage/methylation domain-containing protein n=1 Tax=Sutcliffiella horikoshii TaxID=79883 RepID=A0ABN4ZN61_9BACI|nr:hypothetical protein [Sutcliffiella horikoshii]ART77456.1 hypothetical protein B4U37_15980 [Sutcliffiella horikoshii]